MASYLLKTQIEGPGVLQPLTLALMNDRLHNGQFSRSQVAEHSRNIGEAHFVRKGDAERGDCFIVGDGSASCKELARRKHNSFLAQGRGRDSYLSKPSIPTGGVLYAWILTTDDLKPHEIICPSFTASLIQRSFKVYRTLCYLHFDEDNVHELTPFEDVLQATSKLTMDSDGDVRLRL